MATEYAVNGKLEEKVRRDFPDREIMIDHELLLNTEFTNKMSKRDWTTTRYRPNKVRIPSGNEILIYEATRPGERGKLLGTAHIGTITIASFSELDEHNAATLNGIYGQIPEDHPVTLYHVERFKLNTHKK